MRRTRASLRDVNIEMWICEISFAIAFSVDLVQKLVQNRYSDQNVVSMTDVEMFSLRIVSADHYMAEPCPGLDMVYSEFRSSKIFKLPVIRLYGPTRLGCNLAFSVHFGLMFSV